MAGFWIEVERGLLSKIQWLFHHADTETTAYLLASGMVIRATWGLLRGDSDCNEGKW